MLNAHTDTSLIMCTVIDTIIRAEPTLLDCQENSFLPKEGSLSLFRKQRPTAMGGNHKPCNHVRDPSAR